MEHGKEFQWGLLTIILRIFLVCQDAAMSCQVVVCLAIAQALCRLTTPQGPRLSLDRLAQTLWQGHLVRQALLCLLQTQASLLGAEAAHLMGRTLWKFPLHQVLPLQGLQIHVQQSLLQTHVLQIQLQNLLVHMVLTLLQPNPRTWP